MASEPRPVPTASEQLQDIHNKYGQIRRAAGHQLSALRLPRECGLALIMAVFDLANVIAEQDGISKEALHRVLALWQTEGADFPDGAAVAEALGPVTQPTYEKQVAERVKQDAVWLAGVVPAGLA